MEDPLAVQCNLVGNPLHEEQLEIVRRLGEVYALNTVIDEDRDLVHVTFGEVIESHMAAVDFVTETIRVPVGRRYKTIVTSSAGYPLDKTYYQTVKGMVTPLDILEPGGTLIIASSCSEGFGSPEFREAQGRLVALGSGAFLATLTAKSLAEIDEWQTEMQMKAMRVGRVQLYTTGLDDEERRITGVRCRLDRRRGRRGDRAPRTTRRRLHSRRSLRRAGRAAPARIAALARDPPRRVGGIAGDMFAAAMVDALPALERRSCADAAAVLPPGAGTPVFSPATSAGLHCLRFGARRLPHPAYPDYRHVDHRPTRTPAFATCARIEDRATQSRHGRRTRPRHPALLPVGGRSRVHAVPVDEVHFHELGDWDR